MTASILMVAAGLLVFAMIFCRMVGWFYVAKRKYTNGDDKQNELNIAWRGSGLAIVFLGWGSGLAFLFIFVVSVVVHNFAQSAFESVMLTDVMMKNMDRDPNNAAAFAGQHWCPAFDSDVSTNRYVNNGEVHSRIRAEFLDTFLSEPDEALLREDPKGLLKSIILESYSTSAACRNASGTLLLSWVQARSNDQQTERRSCPDAQTKAPAAASARGRDCAASLEVNGRFIEQVKSHLVPGMLDWGLLGIEQPRPSALAVLVASSNAAAGDNQAAQVENEEIIGDLRLRLVFENQIRHIQSEMEFWHRLKMIVWGPIQLLTLALFFGSGIILFERYFLIQNGVFKEFAKDRIHSYGSYERFMHEMERVIDAPLEYVIWGLPTIGFVGTVIGIGSALGDADAVVYATGATDQGAAIEAVTAQLSIAFDTTLIALICSLPLLYAVSRLRSAEGSIVSSLADESEK